MGIKEKILTVFAFIGSIFSAVFYVLFKMAKDEKKQIESEKIKAENSLKESNAVNKSQRAAVEAGKKVEEDYAELLEEARGDNKLNAFNAVNSVLSK